MFVFVSPINSILFFQEPEDAEDVDSEEYEDDDEFDRHPRKRKKKANDRWSDTIAQFYK